MPRGRPKGSKNAVSRPYVLMVRISEDERGWLATRMESGETVSDFVRRLIEEARKRDP